MWLADDRYGSVADIRLDDHGRVELLVATGNFLRTIVTIDSAEIDAILPADRLILLGQPEEAFRERRRSA